MLEINAFKRDVYGTTHDEMGPSVLKDFLDQLSDIRKKLSNIQSLDDVEIPVFPIEVMEADEEGEEQVLIFTVDEFIGRTRRKLLKLKDESQNE